MENSGEVAALLRRRYPAAKVQTVSFDRRPDMTVTEQVRFEGRVGKVVGGGVAACMLEGQPEDGSCVVRLVEKCREH